MSILTKLSALGLLCCVLFACATGTAATKPAATVAAESSFQFIDRPKVVLTDLKVLDTNERAAAAWSFQENLQVKSKPFGDRSYLIEEVPAQLAGSNWIRTACDSKNFAGETLAQFTAPDDISVFVAFDSRVSPLPAWTKGWTDTKLDIVIGGSPQCFMRVFGKNFPKGSVVLLGPNGQSASCIQYVAVVK